MEMLLRKLRVITTTTTTTTIINFYRHPQLLHPNPRVPQQLPLTSANTTPTPSSSL
jgi:hypothetical protein